MLIGIGDFARLGQVSTRTLRHYQELALLEPAPVDGATGYRRYAFGQLADLHRIVALRELGLPLGRVAGLLGEDVPVEELRAMLRLRRDELAASIDAEQARLRRVEAHLDALERGGSRMDLDVVVKQTDALRVACISARAPGYGYENINPVFEEHLLPLSEALLAQGLRFGPCVAWYQDWDDQSPDGDVLVHLGWEVGDQAVQEGGGISVEELAGAEVASTVIRGPLHEIASMFEALVGWIEASGFELAARPSRELYHELHTDRSLQVTELQLPITRR